MITTQRFGIARFTLVEIEEFIRAMFPEPTPAVFFECAGGEVWLGVET